MTPEEQGHHKDKTPYQRHPCSIAPVVRSTTTTSSVGRTSDIDRDPDPGRFPPKETGGGQKSKTKKQKGKEEKGNN
ncbi:hypothetical protein TNCT_650481 [Trichonephila clavata]|uniref:Uncharacterized protein n=1 Tax=Trichonephila clavata TaxID=2740835 RepID=A0A8X6IM24_TRICU|nr:hypothetical protein TNCT_650481 [Trichonephila clavata]